MNKGWLLLVVVLVVSLLPAGDSRAQYDLPIVQNPHRVVFEMHGDGTITAIFNPAYVGTEQFSWIIPVPGEPEIEQIPSAHSLRLLQAITEVQGTAPAAYCASLFPVMIHGDGGPPYTYYEDLKDPYPDFIDTASVDDVVTELRARGYRITPDQEPLIRAYAAQGMNFVALRYFAPAQGRNPNMLKSAPAAEHPRRQQDEEKKEWTLQPIALTYTAEQPTIPLDLFPGQDERHVLVFVFGETPYVPANYAEPQPDYSWFTTDHQVAHIGKGYDTWEFTDFQREYPIAVQQAIDAANGQAFVTQLRAPTAGMENERTRTVTFWIEDLNDDPLLLGLVTENAYLSRFYGHVPAGLPDPVFVPDPAAPDVARLIDLDDYVDPLLFWGCSSRTYPDIPSDTVLPPQRFHLAEHRLDLRVPDGWTLSTFSIPVTVMDETPWAAVDGRQPFYVLAPQPVSVDDVAAYFTGEQPEFPMLLVMPTEEIFLGKPFDYWIDAYLTAAFGGDITQPVSPPGQRLRNKASSSGARHEVQGKYRPHVEGVYVALLTSEADWTAHEPLYTAMLDYADSYQFYLHPEFQHTLFLNGPDLWLPGFYTQIPYPAGWVEHTTANGDIAITSESSPVEIRLILLNPYLAEPEDYDHFEAWLSAPEHWLTAVYFAETTYGLPEDQGWAARLAETLACDAPMPAVEFQRGGRRGYIRFTHRYLVEVSVPEDEFAAHHTMMHTLIRAVYSSPEVCTDEETP